MPINSSPNDSEEITVNKWGSQINSYSSNHTVATFKPTTPQPKEKDDPQVTNITTFKSQ